MMAIPGLVILPLRDRSLIVMVVVLMHVLLLWSWISLPNLPKPVPHEMSVSVLLPTPPQPAPVEQKPEPKPVVKPKPVEPQQAQPAPRIAQDVPIATSPPQPVVAPPVVAPPVAAPPPVTAPPSEADREPDYHAAYLNNPVPSYPMMARRMGWQGKVVVNVEVLASGLPGQVKLHQSSGHDVLDNAALQAVRSWRFVAARQNGQVVTKWFLVPIPFILKEAE
ncbi:MAG: energy transducer TonB [Gallionella sp.]|nr:energy transducer TonB [Gallionella sp.]